MSAEALIIGFADEAGRLAGVAWSLGGDSGAVVAHDGEVWGPAAKVADAGGAPTLRLELGSSACEVALSAEPSPAPLLEPGGGAPVGEPAAAPRAVTARLSRPGAGRELSCRGHLTRWASDPTEGAGLMRHLVLPAPGDGLIVVVARAEPGATDHAAERTTGWRLDAAGGAEPFAEALLSTQYDGSGNPTRAGLELWPDDPDAPPLRAAAARPVRSEEPATSGFSAALMRTSADGTAGLGHYLRWRA